MIPSTYRTIHASHRRDGRVDAPPRPWRHFEKIALEGRPRDLYRGSPRAVIVGDDGLRSAIVYGDYIILIKPYAAAAFATPDGADVFASLAGESLEYGGLARTDEASVAFDDSALLDRDFDQHCALADDGRWATMFTTQGAWDGARFVARFGPAGGKISDVRFDGRGVGALQSPAQGFAACNGALLRLRAGAEGIATATVATGVPRDSEVAVLGEDPAVTCPQARQVRVYRDKPAFVELAFSPRQPPLDGAEGLAYACGEGIAAFDAGRVRWQKPANICLHATSLGEGGVVVAGGRMLRHYDRDGRSVAEVVTPDGSRFCAPPAPAADGSLHVGTTSGVFVIR